MGRGFTPEEKMELQRKFLQELAKFPEGIAFKALLKQVLGSSVKKTFGWPSFFRSWRGNEKPLCVRLTEFQIQKLGLRVKGLDEYSPSSKRDRIPIFFHPTFKQLYEALKPYEKKTVKNTPTQMGLRVEMVTSDLIKRSRENVEKAIQSIKGIELSFFCPHCGKLIKFREVKEET
jgi:dihydroorotate dehydrogenase